MGEVIWRPTPEVVRNARITRFMERCGTSTLEDLQARAQADPAWFWKNVTEDLGVAWYQPPTQILDLSRGPAWPTWFRGARMNLARDCVDKHVERGSQTKEALAWESEDGRTRTWTYGDLYAESNRLANGLQHLGIQRGDRIGLLLPMMPEAVAAMIAAAKIGAVVVPLFSGFGARAAAGRLSDCGARLLITADAFTRRGQIVHLKQIADEAASETKSIERVIVVPHTKANIAWHDERDIHYHDLTRDQPTDYDTAQLDPETPHMIIYTSGTTGRPKGALHVHGGFPLKAAQDMAHCFDLNPGETMFWFSDLGWMMGPWLIFGTLMLGAAMFLYDGAPDYPGPDRIWAMVERHRITHLGVAPTIIRALAPHGQQWLARHDLSALRIIGGAGEPWNPEPYLWYFSHAGGARCPVINYSGGTETSGGIVGCVVTRPIKVCGFNTAIPGMGATVLDEKGQPAQANAVGELSLTAPWPGMTRGFWQADDRYLQTYWSRFPGVWVHGDWASTDDEGHWYIHGRSDDTIKIAGKRVGPAEYESVLVADSTVAEAAAISVPHPVKGEAVVCFVVPSSATPPDPETLKHQLAETLGKPLAPDRILTVAALPRTRNAKVMRRVIKAAYLGRDPGDLSALENPDAVSLIARLNPSTPTEG